MQYCIKCLKIYAKLHKLLKVQIIYIIYIVYMIYIYYLCRKNFIIMGTIAKKKKIIDIPEDIFKRLSIRAAAEGTNLKSFIEKLLVSEANSMTDEEIYSQLIKNDADGQIPASKEETDNFRNWLKG